MIPVFALHYGLAQLAVVHHTPCNADCHGRMCRGDATTMDTCMPPAPEPTDSPIATHQTTYAQASTQRRRGFLQGLAAEALSWLDGPSAFIDELVYKCRHLPEVNFEIAQKMADMGKYSDAVLRLKIVLWLAPQHQRAHFLLGCSYASLGEVEKAIASLNQAVALDPSDEEAVFMLATLAPDALPASQQPTTMPTRLALEYFARSAATYEATQLDMGYRGHQLADAALWDVLDRRRRDYRVLELGCGTGLCGSLLAEHAQHLTGVDFCREMIELAATRRRPDGQRIYSDTILQDMRSVMGEMRDGGYDAVVAAHCFNYVGEISAVVSGAARVLQPGGAFVFQVERYADAGRFGLLPGMGRFGHGDTYVRSLLQGAGLQLVASDLVQVYTDYALVQYVALAPMQA